MAAESLTPPPPTGGGFAKYIIVALLLLAGGLGVYLAMGEKPAEPPPPPEVKTVAPPTSLSDNTLEIPLEEEEEEDAAVEPEEPEKKPTRPRTQDSWTCRGDLQPADIKRVLLEAQSSIRSCYERRLRNNNLLQGSINLQVRIDDHGKVSATRVRGTMRDQEVIKCVQRLAKNWSFPPPSGGNCAVFDAPYNFTPKN